MIRALRHAVGFAILLAVGCGNAPDGVVIEDAWLRPPLIADRPGAGYFELLNRTDTSIKIVASVVLDPSGATTEIHETISQGTRMSMRRIDHLALAPGERLVFEPGGKHLMVFGIAPETSYLDIGLELDDGRIVRARFAIRGHSS